MLPVLAAGDDWQRVLRDTPRVQLEPGATYTLGKSVELPDGCLIAGNGATITVAHDTLAAFAITQRHDVRIRDVTFRGHAGDPAGTPPSFAHVALRIARSTNVRVEDCDFSFWRGAAITLNGSVHDDYFAYRNRFIGNAFHHCYFGISIADRAEYGQLVANSFDGCRLAIWNSAGNWTIADNLIVACHGGYYAIAQTSPYGHQSHDNWCHGTLVGNTFNHCNTNDQQNWAAQAAFAIGGVTRDPGRGVVVEGLLPPTFTGNTLWYSDIHARDLAGTRWLLSGCVLSNLTVHCHGNVPIELAGTQANGIDNLPQLTGNVRALF
ncbi:MAG TPA: right-handed parallel beta-helix repeat-containing protein [Rhodanobacteraceae bacterium]